MAISDTVSSAQADLEKLVTDVRTLLASKDLDAIPQINVLREKLDESVYQVREKTLNAAYEAARQAKEAAYAADRYAHDEPWRVAGAALAVGALLGFLLARR